MAYHLPENIKHLVPYEPVTADYCVRLDANESFLQPPKEILQEFHQAMDTIEWNRYPDASATELCQAFGAYYGVDPQTVVAFDGSDEVLALMSATLHTGGKLAVFAQDFSMYRQYAETYGAQCVVLSKQDDLTISVDRVLQEIQEQQITAILFSNPCNPTSLGLPRAEVLRLVQNTDALVILDEAYMDFWDFSESLLDVVNDYPNLIVLKTCSKAIGFASVRVGFAVSKAFAKVFRAVKSPYNVNALSQKLATVLLRRSDYLEEARRLLVASRTELQQELQVLAAEYPRLFPVVYPSCTNFVYLQAPQAEEIHRRLQQASVSIRKMGGYLRITAGSTEENRILIQELRRVCEAMEGGTV